jgi:formamidopyrimidine-DNA glycosylase
MPELPEVETTRRGILAGLTDRRVARIVVRNPHLRWPVQADLSARLRGRTLASLERRGKYLLFGFANGTLLVHLGMSGSLRFVVADETPRRHDHIDLVMASGQVLRYHDPRRFGAFLWQSGDPFQHVLLRDLGPEPFSPDFHADYLYAQSRGRRSSIKQFLMDADIVVGVGNIYASEALFRAGVHPLRAAGRISRQRSARLVQSVRDVLNEAIAMGGTTLRDYVDSRGEQGEFAQNLFVYGRAGEACRICAAPIRASRTGQRSTFFCPVCQR